MTIQSIRSKINKNITYDNQGGNLSSDSGLVLVSEFLKRQNIHQLFSKINCLDKRKYCAHSYSSILEQLIFQLIAGYKADSASNQLKNSKLWKTLLGKESLASQPMISRCLNVCPNEMAHQIVQISQGILKMFYRKTKPVQVIVDIDSTHFDTFGNQEETGFNAHYKTNGYHPLVAYDAQSGLCLGMQLRNGVRYTSKDSGKFIEDIIRFLRKDCGVTSIVFRGDSGFCVPEFLDTCEKMKVNYLVRQKKYATLTKIAELFHPVDEPDITVSNTVYSTSTYQAKSWNHERVVHIESTREAGEMIYSNIFILTNLELKEETVENSSETISPSQQALALYRARGNMENFIKESKLGFFMDKTDSSRFQVNALRSMISVLAYNLVLLMKEFVFPEEAKKMTISTIRERLIKLASKITSHARKLKIRFDSTFVHEKLFWKILKVI